MIIKTLMLITIAAIVYLYVARYTKFKKDIEGTNSGIKEKQKNFKAELNKWGSSKDVPPANFPPPKPPVKQPRKDSEITANVYIDGKRK